MLPGPVDALTASMTWGRQRAPPDALYLIDEPAAQALNSEAMLDDPQFIAQGRGVKPYQPVPGKIRRLDQPIYRSIYLAGRRPILRE